MYEHHDAVLHAVREGVLIVDGDGRLLLANDEAHRLLDLPAGRRGPARHRPRAWTADTAELLASGRVATDEVLLAGDRLLAVNQRPTDRRRRPAGQRRHPARLHGAARPVRPGRGGPRAARTAVRRRAWASAPPWTWPAPPRSWRELAVPRFADFATVDLSDAVLRGEEPSGGAAGLRRTAVGGIREDAPLYPVGQLIRFVAVLPAGPRPAQRAAASWNRISPRRRGWHAQDPERTGAGRGVRHPLADHRAAAGPGHGPGRRQLLAFAEARALRRRTTCSLAEELVARAAVSIDNARRYTREHSMAVTLQRSLLPRRAARADAAGRRLPLSARAGRSRRRLVRRHPAVRAPGWRWSSATSSGHGLHAAATMGRLRTAVHNFSALDLPPDELLAPPRRAGRPHRPGRGRRGAERRGHRRHRRHLPVRDLRPGLAAVHDRPRRPPAAGAGPPRRHRRVPRRARRARRWASAGCPSRRPNCDWRRAAGSSCTPTGWSRTATGTSTSASDCCGGALAHAGASPEETCRAVLDALLPGAGRATTSRCSSPAPGARRRQDRRVGGAGRPGGGRRGPRRRQPPARRVGAGRAGLHHRTGPERAGHQRHPLRRRPHPRARCCATAP